MYQEQSNLLETFEFSGSDRPSKETKKQKKQKQQQQRQKHSWSDKCGLWW